VAGVDLARKRDYTVITVMDKSNRHVVAFERFGNLDWDTQYHRIIKACKTYNNATAILDGTGLGDPVITAIAGGGVRVIPYILGGSKAKKELIDKLRINIENGTISFPHIPVLRAELEAYEYSTTESGVVKFSAPTGKHDDTVISLALATWVADTPEWKYKYENKPGI
jgi:phage FluMu gp28-like protein